MAAPLLPIISRIGASLVGRSAAAQAGTKAAASTAGEMAVASPGKAARNPLAEGWARLKGTMESGLGRNAAARQASEKATKGLQTPIAERLEGKTTGQKADWLRKSGGLLDRARAADVTGRDPAGMGLKERVAVSQQLAEQDRQKQLEELNREEAKATEITKEWSRALKFSLLSPVFSATAVIGYKKMLDAVDGIASRILMSQRELSQYSGEMAGAFAVLQRRQLGLRMERAQATGGSAAMLAESLGDLQTSMEPLRQTFQTLANAFGTGLAVIGSKLADLTGKYDPALRVLDRIADWLEGPKGDFAAPFQQFFEGGLKAGGFGGAAKPVQQGQAQGGEGWAGNFGGPGANDGEDGMRELDKGLQGALDHADRQRRIEERREENRMRLHLRGLEIRFQREGF